MKLTVPDRAVAGAPAMIEVLVTESTGHAPPGLVGTLHFASDDRRAELPADSVFTTGDAGSRSFVVTFARAGTTVLTASIAGLASATAAVSVDSGPAARLVVTMPEATTLRCATGSVTSGPAASTLLVLAQDALGNLATGYRGKIRFSSSDPQAQLPGDHIFTREDAGRHVFSALLRTPGMQTVTATEAATPSLTGSGAGRVGGWCSIGPDRAFIQALAGDPSDPSTLYAGTFGAGLFKTTDGGASWTRRNQGISSLDVSSIVVDPHAPSLVYAAARIGLYKSIDGGNSWARLRDAGGVKIVLDPTTTPSTLYAATNADVKRFGVLRSADGGATWTMMSNGLPPTSTGMTALALDPVETSVLYVSFENQGVYRTTNAGANWTQLAGPFAGHGVVSLAVDSRSNLYLGTHFGSYVSRDRGSTWAEMRLGASGLGPSIFIDPRTPSIVYVGGGGQTFVSKDGGVSWAYFEVRGATAIAVGTAGDALFAGTRAHGVLKSIDGAATWASANEGLRGATIRQVAVTSGNPSIVYAADESGFVYSSADGGATWEEHDSRIGIYAFEIDSRSPATLYAAGPNGAAKSMDGGATWVPAGPAGRPMNAVLIDPGDSSTLYLGSQADGVFKSTDGGASWSSSGLGGRWIWSLAADPRNPGTLYAGTMNGPVFKTADGGLTWTQLVGLPTSLEVALLVNAADSSLVVGLESGIYRSTNGGSTWAAAAGLPASIHPNALAADASSSLTLYAALTGVGVYRSTDGGASWSPGGPGLPEVALLGLAVAGPTLYAASLGGGVFKNVTAGD